MENTTRIGAGHILAFLAAALWRALYFAVLGAIALTVFGVLAIGATVPIYSLLYSENAATIVNDEFFGSFDPMYMAPYFWAALVPPFGAAIFAIVAMLASLARYPKHVFCPAIAVFWLSFRRSMQGAILGVVIGGFIGVCSALLMTTIFGTFSRPQNAAAQDFGFGVMIGFAIGTFIGAIKGALDEVKKLREAEIA